MLFLKNLRHDHDDDHDDHGGLHRDLVSTDAAMDRRAMLRVTAKLGIALGAIPLLNCAADGIFSDGASLELATVSGDATGGMTATLTVGI